MPFTMTSSAALDALVTKIHSAVSAIKFYSREIRHGAQLAPDQIPACLVIERDQTLDHSVTNTNIFTLPVYVGIGFKIATATNAGPGFITKNTAEGYMKAIIDAVCADLSLGGACVYCMPGGAPPPDYWPEQNGLAWIGQIFTIQYWRDF